MEKQIHAVLVPWVGSYGHLGPFFELGLCLAKSGVRVSYISTPQMIKSLPEIPAALSPLFDLVEVHLPENITGELLNMMVVYDQLKNPVKDYVVEKSPDWIVSDFIPANWMVDLAEECGAPLILFSLISAANNVFSGPPEYLVGDGKARIRASPDAMTHPPWWVGFPSQVAYRPFEAFGVFFGFFGPSGLSQRVAKGLLGCQAVAIRSSEELEGEYLKLFERMMGKPVIPVGVLPREGRGAAEIIDPKWKEVFRWLDGQKPRSVAFAVFGSSPNLTKEHVPEIAAGLESSRLPFIWALRKATWIRNGDDDIATTLPPDFERKTADRGRVVIGWAPQMEILAHPAIGGSLIHGGWSSVLETLQWGHIPVVLPFAFDQPLNARLLVEQGLAVEVERKHDGSFTGGDVAAALRKAMVEEEGEAMRAKVKKMATVFGDRKVQDQQVQRLVEYLKKGAA